MPAKRSINWRGFAVSLEIPDSVARRLGRERKASAEPGVTISPSGVEIMRPLPKLDLRRRDPVHALDLFRVPPGHEPPTWTPKLKQIPPGTEGLAREVDEIVWYHSIELPGGLVTPGVWNHDPVLPHYGLPADMSGMRALDVATFDGYWAFQMEKRGAEVSAVDINLMSQADFPTGARQQIEKEGVDAPLGRGFELAHRALGSKVHRFGMTVYEVDPSTVGTYDYVHMGDLLVHLERPLEALRCLRRVTTGRAHIVDVFYPELGGDGRQLIEYEGGWDGLIWWRPSLETLAQLVLDAGFGSVELHSVYRIPLVFQADQQQPWRASLIAKP